MYNRYQGNSGRYVRVEDPPGPSPAGNPPGPSPAGNPPPRQEPPGPPPENHPPPPGRPPFSPPPPQGAAPDIAKLLGKLLPDRLETEDLLVLALLYLLYRESGDTEFLIMLGIFLLL
ncbi:MAG: hypothetical protein IJU29_03990 [Oscillospiraceae bacterium]|nr:hypothetical protein [Oscillospiraceae bacterium]